jgi:hypothetical protein
MTTTAIKTHRQQLDELLARLEQQRKTLLNAEVWDDKAILFNAQLRHVFTNVIGEDEESLANYLGDYGMVWFDETEIEQGIPFKADEWKDGEGRDGFYHDYLAYLCDDYVNLLPDGFVEVPWTSFPNRTISPTTGEALLALMDDYRPDIDLEDVMNADVLGDARYECGQALVLTGYLSNQANLTGDDAQVLAAFKKFNPALEKAYAEFW